MASQYLGLRLTSRADGGACPDDGAERMAVARSTHACPALARACNDQRDYLRRRGIGGRPTGLGDLRPCAFRRSHSFLSRRLLSVGRSRMSVARNPEPRRQAIGNARVTIESQVALSRTDRKGRGIFLVAASGKGVLLLDAVHSGMVR